MFDAEIDTHDVQPEADALVGGKIVSAVEARMHFQKHAKKSGFNGQQGRQFVEQSLMIAQGKVETHKQEAERQTALAAAFAPRDNSSQPMQMQQQQGVLIKMSDAERDALRARQIKAQRAMMAQSSAPAAKAA